MSNKSNRPQEWTTPERGRLEIRASRPNVTLRSPLHTPAVTLSRAGGAKNPSEYGGPSGDRALRKRGRRCEVEEQMGTCCFGHRPIRALPGEEGQQRFTLNGETPETRIVDPFAGP